MRLTAAGCLLSFVTACAPEVTSGVVEDVPAAVPITASSSGEPAEAGGGPTSSGATGRGGAGSGGATSSGEASGGAGGGGVSGCAMVTWTSPLPPTDALHTGAWPALAPHDDGSVTAALLPSSGQAELHTLDAAGAEAATTSFHGTGVFIQPRALAITSSGGVVVAGDDANLGSPGVPGAHVPRVDAFDAALHATFGRAIGTDNDGHASITTDASGDVYVGAANGVVRFDGTTGEPVWTTGVSSAGAGVVSARDGVWALSPGSLSSYETELRVVRIDGGGVITQETNHAYGVATPTIWPVVGKIAVIAPAPNGGFFYAVNEGWEFDVRRFDAAGTLLWQQGYIGEVGSLAMAANAAGELAVLAFGHTAHGAGLDLDLPWDPAATVPVGAWMLLRFDAEGEPRCGFIEPATSQDHQPGAVAVDPEGHTFVSYADHVDRF